MKTLGRELVEPFAEFWRSIAPELLITPADIESGAAAVFGDQSAYAARPDPPRWISLPDDDLAYHVAHELTHRLMIARGYPKTVRGVGYPPDSAEARVGEDLEEMTLHPSLESILEPFGFRHDFIQRHMYEGALGGLRSAPVPEYGSPWHFTWAIRFAMLRSELPLTLWKPVETLYAERAPAIYDLGMELAAIVDSAGSGTPERALDAMVRCRDTLGLDVRDKVLVLDSVTGRVV